MRARITFVVALLLFAAAAASAQTASWMRVTVPFAFVAGGNNCPAGDYTVNTEGPLLLRPSRKDSDLQIVLRVYNYAHVDRALLLRTEALAARIMSRAKVQVKWVDSPLSHGERGAYSGCHQDWSTNSFVLNILTPEMSARMTTPGDTLGSAMVPCDDDATSCAIRVFYSKAAKVAESVRVPPEHVLADVIAHEIGHVLLGANHSANGIMQVVWSRNDLESAGVDSLEFSTDQSARLREAIWRRARLHEFKQNADETNGE